MISLIALWKAKRLDVSFAVECFFFFASSSSHASASSHADLWAWAKDVWYVELEVSAGICQERAICLQAVQREDRHSVQMDLEVVAKEKDTLRIGLKVLVDASDADEEARRRAHAMESAKWHHPGALTDSKSE